MIVFHKHQYLWISFNCGSCKILKKKWGGNRSILCWKKAQFFSNSSCGGRKIANRHVKNSHQKLQKQLICFSISIGKSVLSLQKQQQQKNQPEWKTLISKIYRLHKKNLCTERFTACHISPSHTRCSLAFHFIPVCVLPQPHLTSHLEENVFDKFIFKLSECIVTVI